MYNKDLTPINRRAWLRSAAAAVVAAGCRTARPVRGGRAPVSPAEGCALPPVRVSADREIRTIAGLRPYRPSGFVVRAEKAGDALIIHNYGHGGGGITLSWGTARLAVDLLPPGFHGPAGVLGCGVVGLATARLLQEAGLPVTIYAKELPPNTTSNVAGGQWFPFFVSDSRRRTPEFQRQLVAASEFAYRRFQILVGSRYGVRWIRNFVVGNEPPPDTGLLGLQSPLRHLLPELRDLSPSEHPFTGSASVRQFDGMLIEPPIYLAAMLDDVRAAGAVIRVGEVFDRQALMALPEKVFFNCTGLGAKALFGDEELIPLKGQLTFLLPQPEVNYATMHGEFYMFPRSDGILLGGTHESGNWSLEPDLAAKERILRGHREFFETLRAC
ncbi:MAG: FAD-binding oxidoreductase [Acidobacteria bacterium]|nr:FAD-binding oxidoreductase [Acidobacteriota bacterium]